MDINQIYQDFSSTFSAGLEQRKTAEQRLEKLRFQEGFLGALLEILGNGTSGSDVKQAVAIFLKRLIENSYDKSPESSERMRDSDKELLKSVIFDAIVHSEPVVQAQWLKCLHTILDIDFPEKCVELLRQVEASLCSNDGKVAYCGLLVLQQLFSVFKWKTSKQRKPVHEVIKRIFPELCRMANSLVYLDCSNVQAGKALHAICKTYYNSIQYELSKPQQAPESVSAWGALFMTLVQKQLPEDQQPADHEDRPEFPWWKAKKWAFHCLNKLFIRYGNPRETEKQYKEFATKFMDSVAVPLLQSYLQQAETVVKGSYTTPSILYLLCDFFGAAIKHHVTWNAFKDHVGHLVSLFILPLLRISKDDIELFEDDPVEFIRKVHDFASDFKSPTQAASELLASFVEDRPKSTFVNIMTIINNALASSINDPAAQDALLLAVNVLSPSMKSKKIQYKDLLVHYIYPLLSSKVGYVRMRALAVVEAFGDVKALPELPRSLEKIVDLLLNDPAFPVSVQAATTLQELLENQTAVRQLLAPHVPVVLKRLLDLTNKVDVDTLGSAMESMVDNFPDEVAPFAVELAGQLSQTFARLIEPEIGSAAKALPNSPTQFVSLQESQDNTMAALSIVKTIMTIVYSVKSNPAVLAKMELVVVPLCRTVLEYDLCDYFEEVVEILTAIVYHLHTVSDCMWSCLVPLVNSLKSSGEAYISDAVPFMDNIASFGAERFAKQPEAVGWYMDIARIGLEDETLCSSDRAMVCDLLQSLILNLHKVPGLLDASLPAVLGGLMTKLVDLYANREHSELNAVAVFYLQVLIDITYVQPVATLSWLAAHYANGAFFTLWIQHQEKLVRVHDKRLSILVLSQLLSLPLSEVPEPFRQFWPALLQLLVKLTKTFPQALYNKKKLLHEEENDSSDDDYSDEGDANNEVDDLQDAVDSDTNEYMRYLAREAQKALQKKGGVVNDADLALLSDLSNPNHKKLDDDGDLSDVDGSSGYDDYLGSDDFEDDDELLEEDLYFTTPLDTIDVYQTVQRCLSQLGQVYSDRVAHEWSQHLSNDEQKAVNEIMTRANEEVALAIYADSIPKAAS